MRKLNNNKNTNTSTAAVHVHCTVYVYVRSGYVCDMNTVCIVSIIRQNELVHTDYVVVVYCSPPFAN